MSRFALLFIATTLLTGITLGLLGMMVARRQRRTGCQGNAHGMVHKGEKIACPACEQRERKQNRSTD